jgi:hypothetical protein
MLRWICATSRGEACTTSFEIVWKIQWMPPEELVHNGVINRSGNGKRGKRRTNLTWEEYVERYLKDWSITKELVLDRSERKLTIHVS